MPAFKKMNTGSLVFIEITVLIIMAMILVMPSAAFDGAKNGILICGEIIIPSTFPFMILTSFLAKSCMSFGGKKTGFFTEKIFRLPAPAASAMAVGWLSGYPVGAAFVGELRKKNALSAEEAQQCLGICVSAGPAFIITAVGIGIFGSYTAGLILFFSQMAASITVSVIGGIKRHGQKVSQFVPEAAQMPLSPAQCAVSAAADASRGILSVCTFVIFFATLGNIFARTGITGFFAGIISLAGFPADTSACIASGLLEVSSGCASFSQLTIPNLAAASLITGFGGISVLFQVAAVTYGSGIRMGGFIKARILVGALAAVVTAATARLINIPVQAVALSEITAEYTAHSLPVCIILILFASFMLICDKRKGEVVINA